MAEKISIVTDSTADLPLSYYEKHNVQMVPLIVRFEEETFKDWIDIGPKDFYKRMRESNVLPKTSQPSVAQFTEVYNKLARDSDHIISIHLSSDLSGTVQAAEMASEMVDVKVTVIDTKLASLGTGMVVDAAVRAKEQGLSSEQVIKKAREVATKIKILFTVGTLKYLHRGGRIGKAQALVGSILNIKPILTLEDGIVIPYKKVKGSKKVYAEMRQFFLENIKRKGSLYLGYAHADFPEGVDRLKGTIEAEGINIASVIESEVGSVIGTYVGPDTFAFVFYED
jgi:DegV family protein with EDD domain